MPLARCLTPFYFSSASVVPRVVHTLFSLLGQVVIPWSEVLFEYNLKQPLCALPFLLTHYPASIFSYQRYPLKVVLVLVYNLFF